MSKFTPGPWHTYKLTKHWGIYEQNGTSIAKVGTGYGVWAEIREANARLIASAPRLLEACTRARDYLSTIPESAAGGDDDAVALCRVLDEAIKAATGEMV